MEDFDMNTETNYQSTPSAEFGELLWKQIYNELSRKVDTNTFNSWFRTIEFVRINKDKLELSVSSKFIKEWLTNNYISTIKKIARCFKPEITEVSIKVKSGRNKDIPANSNVEKITPKAKGEYFENISSNLNPLFVLKKYVVGDHNRIAFQSAMNVIEGLATFSGDRILFVHSRVGMGKTHLLQSAAQEAKTKNINALYYTAEKFTNQYVFACQNNQLQRFKTYNRNCDIFIIDDIQFIFGKANTMHELMNTIISLMESNKTVIIACDTSPFNLAIDKRLLSRFTGGLVTEIQAPNKETRLEIIKSKLFFAKDTLADDVMNYIADNISNSVRELEGALYKVLNHKNMLGEEVDLKAVKKILHENINANLKMITFDKILVDVSAYYGVTPADILSKSRLKQYVYPRQVISLLAKQLTRDSLQEIGNKLGGKDHATVIYSITKLEKKLQTDAKIKDDINKLIKMICA